MFRRSAYLTAIRAALDRSRIVALIGPRQCGKTTLAREFLPPDHVNYFDLEDPLALARLAEPMTALGGLEGLVVIDEVQRRPELFPILRVLADRQAAPAQFLILGSASGNLLRQSSEFLAGRMETLILRGFSLDEIGHPSDCRHSGRCWRITTGKPGMLPSRHARWALENPPAGAISTCSPMPSWCASCSPGMRILFNV